ncbi:auxin-responsive protein SAUR50-like [Magnolia sinica]|uniref:auxin-responsive protein SAUR50-like n=1 Tax=Magnolia sinica TaxID=86752 RepID=UPI00265A293F|nr:auxin-responsive protein SAUR50-like [Magnolia sinica]
MPRFQEEDRQRTPKGHFAVYVGTDQKRFVVPTAYLKHPIFQQLLDKSADEFGFHNRNRIVLPCDESSFERVRSFLDKRS